MRSALVPRPALALAIGSLAAACSTEQPVQATADLLSAHTPSAHAPQAQVSVASTPAYTQLDDAAARGTAGSLHLSVDAGGDIPRFPDAFIHSVAVFGYAWADLATGRGVVAVIHPTIGRDSRQNPDGWHTHPVELAVGTASSTLCIAAIGQSQGGISIRGDVLGLNMALRQARITASELDVAASFIVQQDTECGAGLGVVILDAETL